MAAAAPARPVRTKRAGERQEALAGYAFIAVPMLLFLVLNLGTTLYAFFISLWDWNIRRGPEEFLGLQNFVDILSDATFQVAIRNSIYYTVIWVPLTMAVGLFLAVIVNQKIRGRPTACSTRCGARSASIRCSRRWASGPTRTGSATTTRP